MTLLYNFIRFNRVIKYCKAFYIKVLPIVDVIQKNLGYELYGSIEAIN